MNQRRLDLGLTWNQVSGRSGMSAEGIRFTRRNDAVPRELNQRGIEKALQWAPGSVAAIVAGGEPEILAAAHLVPGGAQCSVEEFLLGPEAAGMISDESKAQLIRAHRGEDPDGRVVRPAHVGCLPLAPEGRRRDAG
ncbi:MAG TPA: hypothetical protein VK586_03590 [Streptosporangiaceae bacterium]|nr:hypothetical protein [Streptosporangiaceae bacterium]